MVIWASGGRASTTSGVKDRATWRCQHRERECQRPGDDYIDGRHVLTVAHLDHGPPNPEAGLMALCAPCHLTYGRAGHFPSTQPERLFEPGARWATVVRNQALGFQSLSSRHALGTLWAG